MARERPERFVLERAGDRFQDPALSPSGHLLVSLSSGKSARGGWAFPFSADKLETTGAPFRFAPYGRFSVSDGGILLRDVSAAVLVVVTGRTQQREIVGRPGCGARDRNLSWLDWSFAVALSDDGRIVLFEEPDLGAGYGLFLEADRRHPFLRVGDGRALALFLPTGRGSSRARRSRAWGREVLLVAGLRGLADRAAWAAP